MNTSDTSSIGIIGGADGPTAIFISGNPIFVIIEIILILFLIFGVFYLIFKKRDHK